MKIVERIIQEFGEGGLETTFRVSGREYRVFAYPSLGRYGSRIRWNLYEHGPDPAIEVRGLTFGIAEGVREAMEDVVRAARQHANGGRLEPIQRVPRSFRPSPHG